MEGIFWIFAFRFGTLRLALHAQALLHLAKLGQKLAQLAPKEAVPAIEQSAGELCGCV